MFSITTMASSTTIPVARIMANRVRVLIEKPVTLMNAKVPRSETGMVSAGMRALRQPWRNTKITSTTSAIASGRVFTDFRDRLLDDVVVSVHQVLVRGELPREPLHLGGHRPRTLERVGGGQLDDADADRFDSLEPQL